MHIADIQRLMNTYKKIENPKFRHYVLKENRDVYQALKSLFRKYEASL